MFTLSVCMIVKDEEPVLERCLRSIAPAAEELIIIDTGSADGTRDIARAYTDKVYPYDWKDDFADARNYSYSFAASDYIMWIDADEFIEDEERQKLLDLKKTLCPGLDTIYLKWEREGAFSYHERIERRRAHLRWEGRFHELIARSADWGKVQYEDILIREKRKSDPGFVRNMRIIDKIRASGEEISPDRLRQFVIDYRRGGRLEDADTLQREFERILEAHRNTGDDAAPVHPPIRLSLCMIVRDEEETLERCLRGAAQFADEIIIVDTGSADRTKEIARNYTEQVYDFIWQDDFAAARNYAYSFASGDYIMWMDADDVIDDENIQKIGRLKETIYPGVDVVYMGYDIPENGGVSWRQRMVSRRSNHRWYGRIHEVIPDRGAGFTADIVVAHRKEKPPDPERNMNIIRRIPPEEFERDFRLSANCFLDCYRAGYQAEAERFYDRCRRRLEEAERADTGICQLIGGALMAVKDYKTALRWYTLAAEYAKNSESGKFAACQKIVKCFTALGNIGEAWRYNERAAQLDPANRTVQLNRQYFLSRYANSLPT
jgi:glycosyltransferase involved in cell wall biosynthesis